MLQPMDPNAAKEMDDVYQRALAVKQGLSAQKANGTPTELNDFQKQYRANLNNPVTLSPFAACLQNLNRRYAPAADYVPPITYKEAGQLFRVIIAGELARIGRTPFYTEADSAVIAGLLRWMLRDPTGPYDIHRGIFLYGTPGLGKSLIFKCMKILAANVPLEGRTFDIASTKGLLTDISIKKDFSPLTPFKKGAWLLDDLMDEKQGESAAYAERVDVIDWLLTERARLYVDHGLITHVTSNHGRDRIERHYGTRIADRFDELVQFVELTGKTKRPPGSGQPDEEGK